MNESTDQMPKRTRAPEMTSRIMRGVRSRNTKPEMTLRKAVHAEGGRYRLHATDVPGRPDMVVRGRRLAIFVDGDMWHGNPAEWRRRGHGNLAAMFPNRTEWWVAKIERNIQRDREVNSQLREHGWRVLRLWASDVNTDPQAAADVVLAALREGQ